MRGDIRSEVPATRPLPRVQAPSLGAVAFRWFLLCLLALFALPSTAQRVLIVPPAQEEGPPSTMWIGTGLAVALGEALTQCGVSTVPYEDLKSYYEQAGLVHGPTFSLASQVALTRQIGSSILVSGSYKVVGDSISVDLQGLSVSGDLTRLASFQETQSLQELLMLTRKLGEDLAKTLGRPWIPPPLVSPQAFESYIRGRISDDPTLREVYFRKATELQPDYYDASCTLALVLKSTGRVSEAMAILQGLEKKTYAKAYLGLLALAEIRMDQGRLPDARRLLLESLKASEGAEAHIAMARWYARQKKAKECLAELAVAERFGIHQSDIDALRRQVQETQGQPPHAAAPPALPPEASQSPGAPKPPEPAEPQPPTVK